MVGERYFAARIDKRVDVLNGIYKLPRVAEKCTDPWRNQGIVSDVSFSRCTLMTFRTACTLSNTVVILCRLAEASGSALGVIA